MDTHVYTYITDVAPVALRGFYTFTDRITDHPGPSSGMVRGATPRFSSECRCGYVSNWVCTRISRMSTRTDKVASRTNPDRHTEPTGSSRKSTVTTGSLYGLYTEVYVVYWDITGMFTDNL